MRNSLSFKKSRALTLIELLIAIGVVVVLMALLFPAISRSQDAGKAGKCLSNMRASGVALISFAADHNGYLPQSSYLDADGNEQEFWTQRILPYLDIVDHSGAGWTQLGQAVLRCPARPPHDPKKNENYTYGLNYGKASGYVAAWYEAGRVQKLMELTKTFIMADCEGLNRPIVMWPGPSGYWPLTKDVDGDGKNDTAGGEKPFNGVAFVHGGGKVANFLFGDGSVRATTTRQWAENADGMWGDPWP